MRNRKRFQLLGNISGIIFLHYLIKYICKHPNKGAFKYFTMQYLKLVSTVENCITSAHAVEKKEQYWQYDEHYACGKAEDFHQLKDCSEAHWCHCQMCKSVLMRLIFQGFFPYSDTIWHCNHTTVITYFWIILSHAFHVKKSTKQKSYIFLLRVKYLDQAHLLLIKYTCTSLGPSHFLLKRVHLMETHLTVAEELIPG